jgi:Zn-dependent peptidase ImmA (M78 family)
VTELPYFRSPAQLFAELGIAAPSQIDIEAIAQHCGATVIYEPLAGSEAYILGHRDRAIITVNAASSRGRQRFSAAHELGHWMRDRGTASFSCDKRKMFLEWRQENPERLANAYAVDLLLPESMFVPRAKAKDVTFETVRALAPEFHTSLTATAIRLVKLGSFPSILVYCEDGRKKWAVPGPDLFLRLRDEPGPNSIAYDLLRGSEAADHPCDVYADEWVEHRHADRYSVREHSIRSGSGVLALLWWKDERLLLERG